MMHIDTTQKLDIRVLSDAELDAVDGAVNLYAVFVSAVDTFFQGMNVFAGALGTFQDPWAHTLPH